MTTRPAIEVAREWLRENVNHPGWSDLAQDLSALIIAERERVREAAAEIATKCSQQNYEHRTRCIKRRNKLPRLSFTEDQHNNLAVAIDELDAAQREADGIAAMIRAMPLEPTP